MAHRLEIRDGAASFLYAEGVKEKVWHGLGAALPGKSFPLQVAMDHPIGSRAFFQVGTEPLFLADGRPAPARAVVRQDSKAILAAVGPTWTPLQFSDAILAALEAFGVNPDLQTVGVLDGGRTVFGQTPTIKKIPVGNGGKVWEAKLTISDFHYSRRAEVMLTPVDVVCANTLGAARLGAFGDSDDSGADFHDGGDKGIGGRVRHTSGVLGAFKIAAKHLAEHVANLEKLATAAAKALKTPMTQDEQMNVLEKLWNTRDAEGQFTKAALQAQTRVAILSSGVDLIGADEHKPGSAYALFAAVTQYLDRETTRRLSEDEKTQPRLADAGTYLRSALGLDTKANLIRRKATEILLPIGN